jgi:glucose/arabinose dehydrogenase
VDGLTNKRSVAKRTIVGVLALSAFPLVLPCASCSDGRVAPQRDGGVHPDLDATLLGEDALPPPGSFCSMPGSVVWSADGPPGIVAGGDPRAPDLTWLRVPPGFCVHYFGIAKTARQLKFAPGGDLFVASPTRTTTGGAGDGVSGIVVLPDDDHDGVADTNLLFQGSLPAVQGLMFADGFLYYQDGPLVRRVAFRSGDRQPSSASEKVTDMTNWQQDALHWPKVFDKARDGTIYLTNGGSQLDVCDSNRAVRGAIVRLNADASTSEVAKGFRNPIAIRCESDHDVCLVVELALDYSASMAGREKLVPIRQGDDWGYPCCATKDTPYAGVSYADRGGVPDCSGVAAETSSYLIGHTPFGLDFETGVWPAPWTGRAFVTLHGAYQTWEGARVVAVALDPTTGLPLPSTEFSGTGADPANMQEFATGWDDGRQDRGRPAPVAFAPDGRLFLGDDWTGLVVWIAPTSLPRR